MRGKNHSILFITVLGCGVVVATVYFFLHSSPVPSLSTVGSLGGTLETDIQTATIIDDAIQPDQLVDSPGVVNPFTNETYSVRMMQGDTRCGDSRICELVKDQAGKKVSVKTLTITTSDGVTHRGATLLGFDGAGVARFEYAWSDGQGQHQEIGTLNLATDVFSTIVHTLTVTDGSGASQTIERYELAKGDLRLVFANAAVPGQPAMAAPGAYVVDGGVVDTLGVIQAPFRVTWNLGENSHNPGELTFTLNDLKLTFNLDTKRLNG